ncbi:MAG: 3-deoxy-D-manno-octulosonic acid transferase [Bacteroidetes bacterium]|nr:3-deoxy-D-manno-octulosonic acid transferase [Bacteroidota bacterium]
MQKTIQEKNISGCVVWFHCASLGEFEQGRPVIEQLKKENPEKKIVLTFFSPSGYEIRKDYEWADAVFYLPLDTKKNAKKFITLVKPQQVVFVKYEFWLHYLKELKKQQIATYLISAVFREQQHFFKWYGRIFFTSLTWYQTIFVQDENSFKLLKEKGLKNVQIAGDTRFDRVFEIAQQKKELPIIEAFCAHSKVLIAGSTWKKDEELLLSAFKRIQEKYPNVKLIIAPHEIHASAIMQLKNEVEVSCALYTQTQQAASSSVLIIDTIGILSHIYRYGAAAYIGGGFTNGIHNILEALVYEVPVAFGPHHKKFIEAQESLQIGIATEIASEEELYSFFDTLLSCKEEATVETSKKIKTYIQNKLGATRKISTALQ